ncbi:MAG: amidohydrolase, partial [Lachnospiraceae bacterium]|nr:amidohydrolase [Lachnospiraceae bacterium]
MGKQIAWNEIDNTAAEILEASDIIWDCAETAFLEIKSMKVLCDLLRKEGFEVEEGIADVPTAFKGTFGSGKPVIGFLGEYDALSGLNQVAGIAEKQAFNSGAPGHGCGHNMLGTAALSAAMGVKKYLQETGKSGTVIFFGCPGEEGGSGKAFMAKGGAFEGLDAAITWHPGDNNRADTGSSLANYQVAYKFYGTSAHAGGAPHLGRSALDALELMNMGVQFLREHVIPEARIHYAITNTGGYSPNVVQPYAEVLYLIRAPRNAQVEEIYQRVNKIAEGAAHMTETRVEIDFVKGCSNLISNKVIAKKLWENLHEIGSPEYTEEEMALAKAIHESTDKPYESIDKFVREYDTKADKQEIASHKGETLY